MDETYYKREDLELKSVMKYFEGKEWITTWDLVNAIDELLYQRDELEEQNDILKENQRPFNPYKEYGLSEGDFH